MLALGSMLWLQHYAQNFAGITYLILFVSVFMTRKLKIKKYVILVRQALREDMENHRPVYHNLLTMSQALIGVCHELLINNDVVMVIGEVEEVKRRWEALNTKLLGGENELRNSNKTLALVRNSLCKKIYILLLLQEITTSTSINTYLCQTTFWCQSISLSVIHSDRHLVGLSGSLLLREWADSLTIKQTCKQ